MSLKSLFIEVLEIFLLALVIFFAIHFMVQNFRIDGRSMEPNLRDGQYILVNKTAYWFNRNPHRGDIIVFEAPDQPRLDRVKRVIGLPGETVEVKRDGSVYINGALLEEPYLSSADPGLYFGTWTVPDNEYFVMGDYRRVSYDSREGGPVPRGKIIGKAWIIIWPMGDWGFAPNSSPELEATVPQSSVVSLDLEFVIN